MATLERVIQLKQQGMSDEQIIQQLRNEGVSPFEINDSINQARIKEAVGASPPSGFEGMSSSISEPRLQAEYAPEAIPQQEYANIPAPNQGYAEAPDQNYVYAEAPQSYYGYEQPAGGGYSEIAGQIAEQIVMEKFNEFQEKTGNIALFRQDVKDKLKELDMRIARIESSISNLQSAIIQKIGEFGENTESMQRDLSMLHETTSKLMVPLMDNYDALKKILREREEKL